MVKFLASLKLAVITISSFAALMIYGTVQESLHGTEYAQNAVYFSWPFLFVEGLLCTSVLFAALVRLPFKKPLAGFYVIHLGILTLFTGATITALKGIDGTLELVPHEPNRFVQIAKPQLHMILTDASRDPQHPRQQDFMLPLPRVTNRLQENHKAFTQIVDHDLYLDEYIPYATARSHWIDNPSGAAPSRVLWIKLKNANAEQDLQLSSFSYDNSIEPLGPLTLSLVMGVKHDCFAKAIQSSSSKYLYLSPDKCLSFADLPQNPITLEGVDFDLKMTKPFHKFVINENGKSYNYYPQLSAYPVTDDIVLLDQESRYLFDLEAYRKNPNVMFFGDDHVGFGKDRSWTFKTLEAFADYPLPWMNFTLTVTRLIKNQQEKIDWIYEKPKNGEENSRHRVARIRLKQHSDPSNPLVAWVNDQESTTLELSENKILQLRLGPKIHELPFEIELRQFKMDLNPGTNDPASYESLVTALDQNSKTEHRIFMNNPLKKAGFTFYQASYFPLENGGYGSVLSVNRDPGRWVKYLGSFLIVFGSIWHFALRRQ